MLIFDLTRTNNPVKSWSIEPIDEHTFSGHQDAEGDIYFYAVTNYPIEAIREVSDSERRVSMVYFADSKGEKPLEMRIGFSFVSTENAKLNLEQEMLSKSFEEVEQEADATWKMTTSTTCALSIPASIARSCGPLCVVTSMGSIGMSKVLW